MSFRGWCRRSDSNRHGPYDPPVFETGASTIPPLRHDSCRGEKLLLKKDGAEDGIRTRDFLLGKEMLYH